MPQFKMKFSKLHQISNLVPVWFTCICFSFIKVEIFESLFFCFLKLYKIEYRTIFGGFCFVNIFFLSFFQFEDLYLYCWEVFYYFFKSNFFKVIIFYLLLSLLSLTGIFNNWVLGLFGWPGFASLMAQLVKSPSAMQETPILFLVRKIPWKRDRLPTPVFLGFLGGSAGKESACNAGDLGSIPELGGSPGEGIPTPVFWSGEFHGMYSPWGHKESDKSEWLSLSLLVDSWPLIFLLLLSFNLQPGFSYFPMLPFFASSFSWEFAMRSVFVFFNSIKLFIYF